VAWEKANKIGKTITTWEQHEAFVRAKYDELMALPEEQRDVAIVEGHLQNAGMLQQVLNHIDNVLLPAARARESSRSVRRAAKKKAKKKGRHR